MQGIPVNWLSVNCLLISANFLLIAVSSPLPNISTLATLLSPDNPPKSQKWGPQNEFPGNTWTKGFCGISAETLTWNFGFWGPHFQRFGGKRS